MLRVIEKTYGQDYDDLVEECKLEDKLFEDDIFNYDNDVLLRMLVDEKVIQNKQQMSIKWLRPHEICQKRHEDGLDEEENTPRMYVEGVSRFDVIQGWLGDCYFMTALSQLADDKWAFDRVVPSNQTFDRYKGYVGIFRFRFYKFGKWKEIVIDDRLPTIHATGRPLLFAKCELDYDFWTSLVEKAYAKFRGSYPEIRTGLSTEAAVALTGGIPFKHYKTLAANDPHPAQLIQFHQKHTMIFASISEHDVGKQKYFESLGIPPNHSYSITGVLKVGGTYLIRLRNPHGSKGKEWKGDWNDKSSKWSDNKHLLTYTHPDKLDGEFFMSYKDFVQYFNTIELVIMKPSKSGFDLFEWTGSYITPLESTIKANNTITFSLYNTGRKDHSVYTPCSVIVSLCHKYRTEDQYSIFKWNTTKKTWTEIKIDKKYIYPAPSFNASSRMRLDEGDYTIILWHYVSKRRRKRMDLKAGKKEQFHLRLFIETNWETNWGSTDFWQKNVKLSISALLPMLNKPKRLAYLLIKEEKGSDILYQSKAEESNSKNDWRHYEEHEWEPFNINFPDLLSKCKFEVYQETFPIPYEFSKIALYTLIGQFEASLDDLILHNYFLLKDRKRNEIGILNIWYLGISSVKQVLGDESSPARPAHYIIN